jgi:crotonobetainyl-CoA:carnitine CoA-transferase CaiB-like acyl-CoA transferase
MVCAFGGPIFEELYHLMGRDDLIEEYGGDNIEAFMNRTAHQEILNKAFADWVRVNQTAEDLVSLLVAMGVPVGIVKDVTDLLDDPHLKARNMIVDVDHPKLGHVKTFNIAVRFDGVTVGVEPGTNPHDPELGEHTNEVLKTYLGKTDAEIELLRKEEVIWI